MRKSTPWPVCPFENNGSWCRQIIVFPQRETVFRATCISLVLRAAFQVTLQQLWPFLNGLVLACWGHGGPGHYSLVGISESQPFLLLKPLGKPLSAAVGCGCAMNYVCTDLSQRQVPFLRLPYLTLSVAYKCNLGVTANNKFSLTWRTCSVTCGFLC